MLTFNNRPLTGIYIAIAVAAVIVVMSVLRLFVAFCRRGDQRFIS